MATKTKISVNLSNEAAETVRAIASEESESASDVIRDAISVYNFLRNQLKDGSSMYLQKEEDGVIERVHLVPLSL